MAKTEIPPWKAGRKAALQAFRETLPPEDREAMDAAWASAKANAGARRAAKDEQTRAVVALTLDGFSTAEIAKRTGTASSTVRDRLSRLGIEGAPAGMRRTPASFVSLEIRGAIESLSAERGASVAETLRDVLTHAFEEGAFHARRLLRTAPMR